ncbi:hypothetical protein RRG08_050880 [Elysia crispata]|uniref:N-acetyltransferase domain-containing protein n=1 Tax=Elysia crispata TaxID=231223 RepID=A0AAE0ZD99_9GAST|nr:hypothetical protein RRG08_050880 [Elysia crispata]
MFEKETLLSLSLSAMATTNGTCDIVIRKAEPRDCTQIYNLMMELAAFLKVDRDMTLAAEQFYKDIFGEKPVCYCIVATAENDQSTILGYSLYFHIYNFLEGFAISMENLYVSQSHRGRGIGKMLWREVTRIGLELGGTGVLICVDNWNKNSKDWYTRRGCVDLVEAKDLHYLNFGRKEMEAFVKDV